MAERLEHVRQIRGVPTLSEFHRRLIEQRGEGDSFQVSYAAARNYHYDREAPASYLVRVADVFDVRLRWLLTGEGRPTEIEEQLRPAEADPVRADTRDRVDARFAERFPALDYLDNETRAMVLRVMVRAFQDVTFQPRHPMMVNPSPPAVSETVADWLARALGGPVAELRPEGIKKDDLEDYTVLMCQALLRLIPSPMERAEMEREREA